MTINLIDNLSFVLIFIGAVIGSCKSNSMMNAKDTLSVKLINAVIGVFCGVMAGVHFLTKSEAYSIAIVGLVSVVGGASGVIVLEVFISVLPAITKKYINKVVK